MRHMETEPHPICICAFAMELVQDASPEDAEQAEVAKAAEATEKVDSVGMQDVELDGPQEHGF